jgi:hypothetical protein
VFNELIELMAKELDPALPSPVQAPPTSANDPTIKVPGVWLNVSKKTVAPLQSLTASAEMASNGINANVCFLIVG